MGWGRPAPLRCAWSLLWGRWLGEKSISMKAATKCCNSSEIKLIFPGCISICSVTCNRILVALKALMNPNKICKCISQIWYRWKNLAGPRTDSGFCSAHFCRCQAMRFAIQAKLFIWIALHNESDSQVLQDHESESDSEFCRAEYSLIKVSLLRETQL